MTENTELNDTTNPVVKAVVIKKSPVPKTEKLKLSKRASDQINNGIKKYKKTIELAKTKQLNESDTSNIIHDMLAELFWYEKILDITTEYRIKGQFCDYWVKINDKLKFLIEVKQVWFELNDNHLYQASSYAASEWVKWVILTNLREWKIYFLSFGAKIEHDLVLSFDFLSESKAIKLSEFCSYLHKESFSKDYLEKYRGQKLALKWDNLKKALMSKPVVAKIKAEIQKNSKVKVSDAEIVDEIMKLF